MICDGGKADLRAAGIEGRKNVEKKRDHGGFENFFTMGLNGHIATKARLARAACLIITTPTIARKGNGNPQPCVYARHFRKFVAHVLLRFRPTAISAKCLL